MSPAYLTIAEAASLAQVSRHTCARRVESHELSALHLGPHSRRVEARALSKDAPDPIPVGAAWSLHELARWWRVHPRTLSSTNLPDLLVNGRVPRRALIRWVQANTTGPDHP